jgi:hypothetical protein
MFNVLAIGSMVASLLGAPAAVASTDIPQEKITVNVQTVNGSGCPAGSTTVTAAPDNTSFTVGYADYVASAGAGAKPTDFRKNCQLSLRINVPQGFTYAVARADYRGHARLARGVTARQNAYYYFMGTAPTAETSEEFAGPFAGGWATTDRTDVATLVYAPCGAQVSLNMNTELKVDASGSDVNGVGSYLSMDTSKGGVRTIYHLSWKRC